MKDRLSNANDFRTKGTQVTDSKKITGTKNI